MPIRVDARSLQEIAADVLVVLVHESSKKATAEFKTLDVALGGALKAAADTETFEGKRDQVFTFVGCPGLPAKRIVVAGLGPAEDDEEAVRRGAAAAANAAGSPKRVAICIRGVAGDAGRTAEAAVVGWMLGAYRFTKFKPKSEAYKPARIDIVADSDHIDAARSGARVGEAVGAGALFARELGNRPGNDLVPSRLAQETRTMARKHGLRCTVLDEKKMAELGMGSLLSVSRGSAEPARLIIVEHGSAALKKAGSKGSKPSETRPTVCLVGKGLTFDTGGISIKPAQDMDKMRYDMCGGAAVLGTMMAVAMLDLPIHLVGIVASAENMPGSRATKPGDIVRAMNGKTIEVLNTDAEGRLVLADALCYAQRFEPALVIDLATLTGAVLFALGKHMAGMLGTDAPRMTALADVGRATGERVWQLPLDPDYAEAMKGKSADLQNLGGREAGTITAAQFLQHFVEDMPWIHLDIAGMAWDDPKRVYNRGKGATGFGVRLLTRFLAEQF